MSRRIHIVLKVHFPIIGRALQSSNLPLYTPERDEHKILPLPHVIPVISTAIR